MSVKYQPVGWTRTKLIYDAVLLAGVTVFVSVYFWLGTSPNATGSVPDGPTLAMKVYGSCAFLLLTVVLAIGPLARLNVRFLPLLYNRRHFGVVTAAVAIAHALAVLDWYFAYSRWPPLVALLGADTAVGQLSGFAFVVPGLIALILLIVLAATSHDFWLNFLGPPVWKAIHMSVYGAYALVVAHVAFGALQDSRTWTLAIVVGACVLVLVALHLLATGNRPEGSAPVREASPAWRLAGLLDDFPEGRGRVVRVDPETEVAIFRYGSRLSALSNVCAHQNGPLGEGRVMGDCVTCPWHGFQYRLIDGRAPPPFTEVIETYRLRRDQDRILVWPKPEPTGMPVPPLEVSEWVA